MYVDSVWPSLTVNDANALRTRELYTTRVEFVDTPLTNHNGTLYRALVMPLRPTLSNNGQPTEVIEKFGAQSHARTQAQKRGTNKATATLNTSW